MSIVKFAVSNYASKPARKEYARETDHFYVRADKRRDAKISSYERYFDTEAEALEFIADRNAKQVHSKEIDQIKRHAVELLEALEECLPCLGWEHESDEELQREHELGNGHAELIIRARAAIAKAKTPTGNS